MKRCGWKAWLLHRFTTYERDGNGSDEAMMRRYAGKWHRFVQPDPSDGSYDFTNPQSFNRYAYVQNDPVNLIDPLGLDPDIDIGTFSAGDVVAQPGMVGTLGFDGELGMVITPKKPEMPEPQNPTSPEDFRRDTFNKFQADINRCIGEIFGKTAKKIATQTLDIAPALDVTVNGRDLANRSSMRGQLRSIMGLNDPSKGKHGTVYIQSGAWNYPNYPLDVLQGAYIHEYGNILSSKYGGGNENKFGDKAGIGQYPWSRDFDTGANFQRCVFPSSVKW